MENIENKKSILKDLTGKDEAKAQRAACFLIDNADLELFGLLAEKFDFLFPFVKNNVLKRIEKAVSKSNFTNIIKFFTIYSPCCDDLFASILAKHADESLTDTIFELLENGSENQKTYAAKYFSYITDTAALEVLSRYAFSNNEYLSANSAEALGQMQDDVSFDISLNALKSGDDFDKLKAVKFFSAYGRNYPFKEIFDALKNSGMPENIAGQIPYMESLLSLLESEFRYDALITVYYIIAGLGEILPLSDIFQFELYEVTERLIYLNKSKNDFSALISVILLSAESKFRMFSENEEYIFDEDKNTKYEAESILKLLQAQNRDFWNSQRSFVPELLKGNDIEIRAAMAVISEFNLNEAAQCLKELISSDNETLICEALNTLKSINSLDGIDIKQIAAKIQNPNIKALIENLINN